MDRDTLLHMADFEGIQLIGDSPVGGGVLMLSAASDVSGIAHLPDGIEVEVRQGISAVVVRGVCASDYNSIIDAMPEQANRALDIFAMIGTGRLALADVWSNHIAWWWTPDVSVVRIWCSSTLVLTMQIKGVVSNPDGAARPDDVSESSPQWHESMRYFRMSEITDDLFDAFRNIYLALESLLNELEPRKDRETEGVWLKRALKAAGEILELSAYQSTPTNEPANDLFVELWKKIRNRIFHAKSASISFLPQDAGNRTKVADAKSRYTSLYLDLAYKTFGSRLPSRGLRLSSNATRSITTTMTDGWQIGFGADPSSEPGGNFASDGAIITVLPTSPSTDPRGESFSAVIADIPVSELANATTVGRIFTFTADGQSAFAQSLDGRLTVNGFDRCEFLVSVSVEGLQRRKTLYAT